MRFKFTPFQILVHVCCWIPFIVLIWDYFHNNLTFNPIQEATFRTGKTALTLLVLTLAVTPINTIFGFREVIKVRRPLGLYTFFYASIHFLIFVGVDYNFNWNYIKDALFEKRYAYIGFTAFLIMLPMALTSTKGWQKRLKVNWKRLHKFIYVAGLLVVTHYMWAVKSDIRIPLVYGAIIIIFLIFRIPGVRNKISQTPLHKLGRKSPAHSQS